jgi:D-psicose/D-tagatose/L-ribulose 3-epimerase
MPAIGICTDFVNLPEAAGLGFDYVELSLAAVAALPEADFIELADWVDAAGIQVRACRDMLPDDLAVTGPGVNATALHGYLRHALGRARRLGVKAVALDAAKSRAVSDDGDFPYAWRQLGNFLRLCQGHAKECGITVCLEPLRKADCSLLNLVSEATLIAGLLQLDRIAVAAHWGHMSMASEPMDALWRAAPLLRHVHLENALTRRLPAPGDGEDYARMLSPLNVMGYAGGISLCGTITETFIKEAAGALAHIRALSWDIQ